MPSLKMHFGGVSDQNFVIFVHYIRSKRAETTCNQCSGRKNMGNDTSHPTMKACNFGIFGPQFCYKYYDRQ